MKQFLLCILLLFLAGCCRLAELPPQTAVEPPAQSSLYRFRLERSSKTKFSGLLAIKPREDGMWSGLLDATGIPLVKVLVHPDGTMDVEYCTEALRDSRLPDLIGKLVEYIYFTPANADCPWYVFSCVCMEREDSGQSLVKWKRFGPMHLWEMEQTTSSKTNEKITVHMNLSAITVHLQRLDTETGK